MADKEITFTNVHIYKRNHVAVLAVIDEHAEQNLDHTMAFRRFDGKWYHRLIDNSITGICIIEEPTPKVLNMGIDGIIDVKSREGETTETVDASSDGPNRGCFLTCMRKIGAHVYVTGGARQVYRREAGGKWIRVDDGVFVPRDKRGNESMGFSSIDGHSEDAIYAVGLKGEIWFCERKGWTQLQSPTSVGLNVIRCIPDGRVYVCGMAGVLLQGNGTDFKSIAQDLTKKDFWGLTFFQDKIYVSDEDGVFRLNNEKLEAIDMGLNKKLTTKYLDANDGVLWSVGHKDLACTEDGETWTELDKP